MVDCCWKVIGLLKINQVCRCLLLQLKRISLSLSSNVDFDCDPKKLIMALITF